MKKTIAILATALLLTACTSIAKGAADPAPTYASPVITTVTHTGDIHVTAALGDAPQVILTTQPAAYDGKPVTVDLGIEYVNEIPDVTQYSNGIGFELYEDGTDAAHHLMRLTLFGEHQVSTPEFGPVFPHVILDGAATPTAGMHTFYLTVWKWQPAGDGYLRGGDNTAGGVAQPIRLTISHT